MTTVLDGIDALVAAVGRDLGTSAWLTVRPERFEQFARATGDPSCDYLAVALSNYFLPQIVEVRGVSAGLNYGADAVRLGPPMMHDERVRARAELVRADPVTGGVQTMIRITLEAEGQAEPVCVIESLSRWLA
jgi:acyl dehydratase